MQEKGDTFRDTVALTVRGDGKDIPPFTIVHTYRNASKASGRRCAAAETPIKGMDTSRMIDYIDHISQYVPETSLLLMDRLSSHTSPRVRAHIEGKLLPNGERTFLPLYLPAKTSFLISHLDMGAIAAFKMHYYRLDRSTIHLKLRAIQTAWDRVSNDALSSICLNCGIIGEETLDSLRTRFEREVVGSVPAELEECSNYFDAWKSGALEVQGATRGRRVTLDTPDQLEEGHLDGVYWVNYGRRISI